MTLNCEHKFAKHFDAHGNALKFTQFAGGVVSRPKMLLVVACPSFPKWWCKNLTTSVRLVKNQTKPWGQSDSIRRQRGKSPNYMEVS